MKKQYKYAIFCGATCIVILLVYFWMRSLKNPEHLSLSIHPSAASSNPFIGTPMPMRSKLINNKDRKIEKDKDKSKPKNNFLDEAEHEFAVDTPGCKIPQTRINYMEHFKAEKKNTLTKKCGIRAVFFKNIGSNTIQAFIDTTKIISQNKNTYHCYYRFFDESNGQGLSYTSSMPLINGAKITLETDFIRVKCIERHRNRDFTVYEDFYAFTKEKKASYNRNRNKCTDNYNILMLGMDSMSLPRLEQTMPRTTGFLKKNKALSFRGYHKVGDNTFPNLMAALSGYNIETLKKHCWNTMDQCNIIWAKFKEIGYITAYGEDFLGLPDTFGKHFKFGRSPTDHHIRPLFLRDEKEINKTLICTGKESAGKQLLDYATDFVTTYYQNHNFFGVFWLNSFSHNENSRPQDTDELLETFLSYTASIQNTFVIFFSDQGLRFGKQRTKLESYYDERLPFLFILPPKHFRQKHPHKTHSLETNQLRLVTPYDLYNTLYHLYRLSDCRDLPAHQSHACLNCTSLFTQINTTRRCQDVAIDDKWCSCHKLNPLDPQDSSEGMKSVQLAVSKINRNIQFINTKPAWICAKLSLHKIIRTHFYYDERSMSLYFVVAFTMTPGNVSFEATVTRSEIVGDLSVISPYRGLGNCTISTNIRPRLYCICEKNKACFK